MIFTASSSSFNSDEGFRVTGLGDRRLYGIPRRRYSVGVLRPSSLKNPESLQTFAC